MEMLVIGLTMVDLVMISNDYLDIKRHLRQHSAPEIRKDRRDVRISNLFENLFVQLLHTPNIMLDAAPVKCTGADRGSSQTIRIDVGYYLYPIVPPDCGSACISPLFHQRVVAHVTHHLLQHIPDHSTVSRSCDQNTDQNADYSGDREPFQRAESHPE